jgi:hypothetical protein
MKWRTGLTKGRLLGWTLVLIAGVLTHVHAQIAESSSGGYSQAIEDNSFFLEEAYNQEERVVQHISTGTLSFVPQTQLLYSFTQEWPIGGRKHQLSFTVPLSLLPPDNTGQFGDVLVNYRLQMLDDDAWCAIAPRLSVVLPTGKVSSGIGSGVFGLQVNLPASKRLSERFVAHANAGVTFLPNANRVIADGSEAQHDLVGYNAGASLIWLAGQDFNVMFEALTIFTHGADVTGTMSTSHQVILNPGFRWAINVGSLQIVPGIGVPFTIDSGVTRAGVFVYLSFEHPY